MEKNRVGTGKIGAKIRPIVEDKNPLAISKKFIPNFNEENFFIGLKESDLNNSLFGIPSNSVLSIEGFGGIGLEENAFTIDSKGIELYSSDSFNYGTGSKYEESITGSLFFGSELYVNSFSFSIKQPIDITPASSSTLSAPPIPTVDDFTLEEPEIENQNPFSLENPPKLDGKNLTFSNLKTLTPENISLENISEGSTIDTSWLKEYKKYSFGILDGAMTDVAYLLPNMLKGFDVIAKDIESVDVMNAGLWSFLGIEKGKSLLMKEALNDYYNGPTYYIAPYPLKSFNIKLEGKKVNVLRDLIVGEFSRIMMDPDAEMQYFIAWISKSREETPINVAKGGYTPDGKKNANYFFYIDNIDFAPAQKSTATVNYGGIEIPVLTNHVEGKNVGKFTMWGDLGLSFYNYVLNHALGYNTEKGTYSDVINNRKFSEKNDNKSYGLKTNTKADDIDKSMLDLHIMMPGFYLDDTKTFYVNHFILRAIKFQSINSIGFNHETKQIQHSVEFDYLKAIWIHNRSLKLKVK